MRRYVDFGQEDWAEKTDSRMQAARWAACMEGLSEHAPLAGVLSTYPEELLLDLMEEGFVRDAPLMLAGDALREAARQAVLSTLSDDADCLSQSEHQLIERMLIGGGATALHSVADLEAAYTLRMRLWCDVGLEDETPICRLDPDLEAPLRESLSRPEHFARRARVFIFEGMMHGILYLAGHMDEAFPAEKFIEEVLEAERTPEAYRLAHNFLEASFDTFATGRQSCLVHEALADPSEIPPMAGWPEFTPGQFAASVGGLLPEEAIPDETLRRALSGALRPEYELDEAASDLRFLAKQDVPVEKMREVMAGMLVVLPTPHMDGALEDLTKRTPRWIHRRHGAPFPHDAAPGVVH